MKRLLLFAFLLLSNCMSGIMDDDYTYIDPVLRQYVDEFFAEAAKRNVDLSTVNYKISVGTLAAGVGGVTNYKYHAIIVDTAKFTWKKYPENTMFHELGHLFLHRKHDDRLFPNGEPKSIMNSGAKTPKFTGEYASRREYYINELFTH